MASVLGFDFGTKYIGVAVGQHITQSASPVTTLKADQGEPRWKEIEDLIALWKPGALLVGIPLNMDGTEQDMTHLARDFASSLRAKTGLSVVEVDERLSTWEAKNRVYASQKSHQLNKKILNQINSESAVVLLEQWLRDQQYS